MSKFPEGTEVKFETTDGKKMKGEVQSFARGWYQILASDGSVRKVRESAIVSPKVKAEKAPKPEREPGAATGTIIDNETRKRYERYKYEGEKKGSSVDNADPISLALRGLELDNVYALVASIGVAGDDLKERYANLNPGQQRMALGTRLRGGKSTDRDAVAAEINKWRKKNKV